MAKVKQKTHKATAKRFRLSATGKVMHHPQGGGNGHARSFKNRRQRKAGKGTFALNATKEIKKIKTLLNK